MVAHVFISGFVHGVGFRQHIKSKAKSLDLTGWIRNLPDGRVEAVFSGEKDKIEDAVSECSQGPFFSEVKGVEVEWLEDGEKFTDFQILHQSPL